MQASLPAYVLSWVLNGSMGRTHHLLYFQVLYGDEVEAADQRGSGLFDPVPAPIRFSGGELGELELGPGSAVGALGLPGQFSLQSTFTLSFSWAQELRHMEVRAVRSRDGGDHSHIQADLSAGLYSLEFGLGLGEAYVPSAICHLPERSRVTLAEVEASISENWRVRRNRIHPVLGASTSPHLWLSFLTERSRM